MVAKHNKKRLDGRKQNNTRTAVPVRKVTVLTSCDTPSRITCNQIITGTYPWYIRTCVHPTKKSEKRERGKQYRKEKKRKKNESKTKMRSWPRPSPEGKRLLFARTISSIYGYDLIYILQYMI